MVRGDLDVVNAAGYGSETIPLLVDEAFEMFFIFATATSTPFFDSLGKVWDCFVFHVNLLRSKTYLTLSPLKSTYVIGGVHDWRYIK